MTRALLLLALAAVLAAPVRPADARPGRHAAPAQAHPALKARQAAMAGFANRMSRLDALMGPAPKTRARSASAEH